MWKTVINAIQLKIAKEDPWLVQPCNYFDEVEKMTTVESNRRMLRLFRVVSKLALVDAPLTDYSTESSDLHGTINVTLNPITKPNKNDKNWTLHLFQLLAHKVSILIVIALFIVYPVFKLQSGAFYLFERDKLLKNYSDLALRSSKLNDTKCIYESEISPIGKDLRYQLERKELQMREIGVCHSAASLSTVFHALVSSVPIVFYLITAFLLNSSELLKADHIVYMIDPTKERTRLNKKIKLVVQILINSLELSSGEHRKNNVKQSNTTDQQCDTIDSVFLDKISVSANSSEFRYMTAEMSRRIQRKFIHLIRYIVDRQLVRPIGFSFRWHMDLITLASVIVPMFMAISFYAPILTAMGVILMELDYRTTARLDLLECQARFQAGAINDTVLLAKYVFTPKLILVSDIEHYSKWISSQSADTFARLALKINLLLTVEAKYYFTLQAKMFVISYHFATAALMIGTTTYAVIYVTGMLNKLAWLEQISCQVKYCIDLVVDKPKQTNSASEPIKYLLFRRQSICTERNTDKHLVYLMTVALINFELFRRNHRPFHRVANFLALQMCTFCVLALLFCYMILIYAVSELKKYILVSIFFLALTLNIYIGYSSCLSNKAEKLVRRIARLVALFPMYHFKEADIKMLGVSDKSLTQVCASLWRRYLFSEEQTRETFAPNLLGYSLDVQRLISLNAYTIALCLFLWK